MKHRVQRQYILDENEVKEAIYDYLKKMYKPIPDSLTELEYAWNANKECFIDYNSEVNT